MIKHRLQTWFREPVAGLMHAVGAVVALFAGVWLVSRAAGDPPKMISLAVYAASLILLLASSATMHLYQGTDRAIDWLNRIDHASIYMLTGGTYTAVLFNTLSGVWRWGMLALVWVLAIFGIIYKLAIGPRRGADHLSTLYYVGMGWLAVIVLPQIVRILPFGAIALIAAGGMAYSVGAIIYTIDDPDVRPFIGLHELWHLLVLTGSGLHFVAVALYIA